MAKQRIDCVSGFDDRSTQGKKASILVARDGVAQVVIMGAASRCTECEHELSRRQLTGHVDMVHISHVYIYT